MPIVPDLATFRILYPEFDNVSEAEVVLYLDMNNEDLDPVYWGTCLGRAVLALTAHQLALSQNSRSNAQISEDGFVVTSSGIGGITSASAGEISVSYQAPAVAVSGSANDSYYNETKYGKDYLSLKRECLPQGILATCQ